MSYEVRDKEDAMIAVELIRELEHREMNLRRQKKLIELKQSLREYYKRAKEPRRVIKDYGIDGYVEEVQLPDWIMTKEEAEDYFNEVEKITYRPRAWDCTGQRFTQWHFIVWLRGKWWLCHEVAVDI